MSGPSQSGAEQALRSALADREVLYAELEHRMKNVMQMITSFLSLQASRAELPETKAALHDVMRRVQGLDVAQRALLKLGALDRVDLAQFLPAILRERMLLDARPDVTCDVAVEAVEASVDQASALGLVVNELAMNALKHAFPGGGGVIRLEVRHLSNGRAQVVVADNGIGLPGGPIPQCEGGLGMALIHALSRQAHAELLLSGDGGTRAALDFPLLASEERG